MLLTLPLESAMCSRLGISRGHDHGATKKAFVYENSVNEIFAIFVNGMEEAKRTGSEPGDRSNLNTTRRVQVQSLRPLNHVTALPRRLKHPLCVRIGGSAVGK